MSIDQNHAQIPRSTRRGLDRRLLITILAALTFGVGAWAWTLERRTARIERLLSTAATDASDTRQKLADVQRENAVLKDDLALAELLARIPSPRPVSRANGIPWEVERAMMTDRLPYDLDRASETKYEGGVFQGVGRGSFTPSEP